MIQARRNRIGIGVECQIEGNTVEIVGELAAMIKAVRKGLEKYYDETAVNEVIVNIGRAAYSDRPQQVEELCIPLLGKNKIGGSKSMGEYKEAKTTIANMCPVCVRCGHVFESLKMIRKPEETKIVDNETILHKFPPIRWEPAACPNCGAHIKGLRYRGREAEIDWQGLEHRELSAGFKEWKYEK